MNEELIIRKVELRDAAALARIYNYYVLNTTISFETEALSVEQMERRIALIAAECPYLVAEKDGQLLGYCYVHPWKDRAAYSLTAETTVYLNRSYTGAGLGTLLMRRLIEACREAGYAVLIACITGDNAESCVFHEKLGFERVSHFHRVGRKFGQWLDVVDYELILNDVI